ncbi:MAG: cation:proton antiporter [Candidatus Omnitrophica bacterium]|nr:cation:proton antiporter [Candidatus Omnitrophota bacterium]
MPWQREIKTHKFNRNTHTMDFIPNISFFHLNILFILGLALFGGTIGGRLFQKIRVPQVVGYIIIGIILGQSGINLISKEMITKFQPFNYFALGLIGFMIGGELKKDDLTRYGKQFLSILLCEGIFSFALVTVLLGVAGTFLLKDPVVAWSLALMLGAISSATAPAATTDVLWEYKAKGPLTKTIFGIVALDDVLSIALFAIASSTAKRMLGGVHENVFMMLWHPLYEIGGAIIIGMVSGYVLIQTIKHYHQKDRMLIFLIGTVMFVLGLAVAIDVSMLLAAMVLGVVVVNGLPHMTKQLFDLSKDFTPPIFILFFVFIGAKLNIQMVSPLLIFFIILYLFGQNLGKMSGAYLGAKISGAPEEVKKYLPWCLFSQAGVAIGLSIVAAHFLNDDMANTVIVVITASTFIVQLIGPPCVKLAITKAKEIGKNITEEDILESTTVDDLLDIHYPIIHENTPGDEIIHLFSNSPYTQYPVVDRQGHLAGLINIDGIKNSLQFGDSISLLLAEDVKDRFNHFVPSGTSLLEAKKYMDSFNLGFLPIANADGVIIGCFDRRMYKRFISSKLLELGGNS